MVEAIEDLFVPVLVYNNIESDKPLLEKFDEKSWNNPVVRYLDASAQDLVAKKENIWTTQGTAQRMVAALKAKKRRVPKYLDHLAEGPAKTETAIFAMHCYWEGEAKLGKIPGVQNTRSAWLQKKEVVEVEFDPNLVDFSTLMKKAHEMECASTIFATNDEQEKTAKTFDSKNTVRVGKEEKTRVAKESDQKYYLRNSTYRFLPLTRLQSTKINAILANSKSKKSEIHATLSPRQLKLLELVFRAKKINESAFTEFVFPEDDSKLMAYHEKLESVAKKVLGIRQP